MTDIDRSAPVQAKASATSAASTQSVFNVLVDVRSWSSIYPDLRELEVDGSPAVGMTFRFKSGPMHIEAKITGLEAGRMLAFDGSGKGASSAYRFTVADGADGGAELMAEQSMSGLAVRTMKPMLQKIADSSLQTWSEAIARAAEAPSA